VTEEDEIKNDFNYKISTLNQESSVPSQKNISFIDKIFKIDLTFKDSQTKKFDSIPKNDSIIKNINKEKPRVDMNNDLEI
jgi:hypothetical protein